MPRARFQKLSADKQNQIYEAAAREFSANGYEGASINKILDAAHLSKGAAYYYFDDKADLFAATVQHYAADLVGDLATLIEPLTAATFWPTFADRYTQQFTDFYDRPWAFGAIKAAGRLSPQTYATLPALAATFGQVQQGLAALIRKGQTIGLVRTDLPEDLLVALFIGIDDATDQWVLAHWETLSREELVTTARRVILGVNRILAPPRENSDD